MKVVRADEASKALDNPGGKWRAALLHGPDEGGSRAMVERLAAAMGADAERVDLDGATLREDPARLTDEVTAITMFGGPRWVRVTTATGDDVVAALTAMLDAPSGAPVAIVAGQLRATSALLKLAIADPRLIAHASYRPEGAKADALALQIGRTLGVRLSNDAARLLADACNGDQSIMQREVEKLVLYADAAPDRPRTIDVDAIHAIGAAIIEHEPATLVNTMFDGTVPALASELSADQGVEPIPAIRAMLRRTTLLARQKNGGAEYLTKSLSMKDKDAVGRQLRSWSPAALATVHRRLMMAEESIKQPGTAGDVLARQEWLALARMAERRR